MDIFVRTAHPSDIAQLVALTGEFYAEVGAEKGGDIWLRRHQRPPPLERSLDATLDDPDTAVLLGMIDDVTLGFGVVRRSDDPTVAGHSTGDSTVRANDPPESIAVIEELFVTVPARGVGVGRALLDAIVEWAADQGCSGVDAVALPGARETKNFFEAAHFTARAIVVHHRLREAPATAAWEAAHRPLRTGAAPVTALGTSSAATERSSG